MHDSAAIVLTIDQLWKLILGFFGGVTVIITAWGKIYAVILKAKEPTTNLEKRVTDLEKTVNEHEQSFKKDKETIEMINDSSRVTQKALLAIIEYQMTGESTECLKNAKDELQSFLINK